MLDAGVKVMDKTEPACLLLLTTEEGAVPVLQVRTAAGSPPPPRPRRQPGAGGGFERRQFRVGFPAVLLTNWVTCPLWGPM